MPAIALRVLVVTRLFPSSLEPLESPFARQQLAALGRHCAVLVLGVVPHLPGARLLGDRTHVGRLTRLPERETVADLAVIHPRAPYVPGVAHAPWLARLNGPLYLAGLLAYLPMLRGRFDVVLGTFLYPDACAAAALARLLGIPHVIKAHGTDVDVVARWPGLQKPIAAALGSASWSLGVSRAMVASLVDLGARPDRAVLLENGVDRALFRPRDRASSRAALGLPADGRVLLFVGLLAEAKGLRELLVAWTQIRDDDGAPVHLVIVGDGPLRGEIACAAALAKESGSAHRGLLVAVGGLPLDRVALHLGAADVFVLPSHREGTPNVILEALASGRPVVATRVGGIADVVAEGTTGLLVPPRSAADLARALRTALARTWDVEAIAASAPGSWDESAARLHGLLALAVSAGLPSAGRGVKLRAP